MMYKNLSYILYVYLNIKLEQYNNKFKIKVMVHYTLLSYHEKSLKKYKDYKLEFQVFFISRNK